MNKQEYVWYASYGSNMNKERFLCYIKGGVCSYNDKYYIGCDDKSDPLEDRPIIINHRLYFGNSSGSWAGAGVAFISPVNNLYEKTLGRMYLITKEQFKGVLKQESNSPDWYGKEIVLGEADGYEIKTFTNERILLVNDPCEAYIRVISEGIKETYPKMNDEEIDEYIQGSIGGRGVLVVWEYMR